MAKYIPDSKSNRWVVIASSRTNRPDTNPTKKSDKYFCPFCEGNEEYTPPELWRIGGEGLWNKPGWKVRVVPNKFPITDIHEVIIHSTDDEKDIAELPREQVRLIMQVYKDRFNARKNEGHVLIFNNHGQKAGASLKHPHSQLVVLPKQITMDVIVREPISNIVWENKLFVVYCPDFSQWPFEIWIAPKNSDEKKFGDITDEELNELTDVLQKTLKNLKNLVDSETVRKINKEGDFAYNFYIYHEVNWYLRIIPRFIHRAGFELGTGLSVNTIGSEFAAIAFRELMKD